ncbi:unnamed protein product [Parnassius mnemosyne]|uniref:Endonuclease/exonuclease/phosphatase domain-containing protein n=1 Tax=Parnassius mnemosyne TaxID=213953 RepID=A0AAV1K797_9NEOP
MAVQHTGRTKPSSLTVAFFNANGIRDQKEEIVYFLRDHDVDIMLVQETFLKPSVRDPKIANYTLVRNDRLTGPKGGTLIYYKRSLHCIPLDTPPLANLEASVCRIALTGHPPVIIASAYQPPQKPLLEADISALLNLGPSVVIAGDLNTILKDIRLNINSIETFIELCSDHRPIVLELGRSAGEVPQTKTIVDWRKLKVKLESTNSQHLDSIPDKIDSPEEANRAISALSTHLTSAVEEWSRKVRVSSDRYTKLPADVRRLIRAKNSATVIARQITKSGYVLCKTRLNNAL